MNTLVCSRCGCSFETTWRTKYCSPCFVAVDRESVRRNAKKFPATVRAHWKVQNAILAGLIPSLRNRKTPCVDCGKTATQYDHRDYLKPLEVESVCASCNAKRGPGLNRNAAA